MNGPLLNEKAMRERLFEAALEPELWNDCLVALSDYVDGSSVNLIVLDRPGERPFVEHFVRGDDHTYASYIETYIAIDRRVPRVAEAPVNTVLLEHQVLTEEEKRTDIVYNEVLATGGMRNLMLTNLSAGPTYMGIGVAPRDDGVPFEAAQVERLTRILPDFRHALKFYIANRDLQLQRRALGDLWAQAGKAVLILNPAGAILFANRRAEEMQRAGLFRIGRGGRLRFGDRASELAWQQEAARLGSVAADFGEFLAEHPFTRDQYAVRLVSAGPIVSSLASLTSPAVILTIEPLSDALAIGAREIERFCRLFGVTAAESRAVAAVAAGRPLDELAAEAGIALDTVRKQLKSAMLKCGVSSQKALISRLERFCFVSVG